MATVADLIDHLVELQQLNTNRNVKILAKSKAITPAKCKIGAFNMIKAPSTAAISIPIRADRGQAEIQG